MILELVKVAGEFCTSRKSPALIDLKERTDACLSSDQTLEVDLLGVKVLTPSFIDEWLPDLIIKYGEDKFHRLVVFNPPLEGFLKEQITRGVALRRMSQ